MFASRTEIDKQLLRIMGVHTPQNAAMLVRLFYDTTKIAYYALQRKIETLLEGRRRPKRKDIRLRRTEITRLLRLVDFHYSKTGCYDACHELTQCFGWKFTEADACKFFEQYVEGETKDRQGRVVLIDLDAFKFMYKDPKTGGHDVSPENYVPSRGKRLPWIRHTIRNTDAIYERVVREDREIMYVAEYKIPFGDGKFDFFYWLVIASKYRKDRVGPFKFRTAFFVMPNGYNSFLKRLETYGPARRPKQRAP